MEQVTNQRDIVMVYVHRLILVLHWFVLTYVVGAILLGLLFIGVVWYQREGDLEYVAEVIFLGAVTCVFLSAVIVALRFITEGKLVLFPWSKQGPAAIQQHP